MTTKLRYRSATDGVVEVSRWVRFVWLNEPGKAEVYGFLSNSWTGQTLASGWWRTKDPIEAAETAVANAPESWKRYLGEGDPTTALLHSDLDKLDDKLAGLESKLFDLTHPDERDDEATRQTLRQYEKARQSVRTASEHLLRAMAALDETTQGWD